MFSLNQIAFNKQFNTFVTIGGDGHFFTWNKDTKSKYKSSKKFPGPITCTDFSEDGRMLVYAIGYDWSRGAEGAKTPYPVKIILRTPDLEQEVFKPKTGLGKR